MGQKRTPREYIRYFFTLIHPEEMHMHRFLSPYLLGIAMISLLFCTAVCTAAVSDHPVVTAITGPNNLNDGYGPTGSYVFMAAVSGGTPPYTYKWMNPPGMKTLFEGKEYASVTIPANQLFTGGGPGHYGVWLTVTDSAGKDALWQREGGAGNSNQYFYGMTYGESPSLKWTVTTEPKTFPPAAASGSVVAQVTTAECPDSGARFSGVSGQVQVTRAGKPEDSWKTAKIDTVLCEGDTIETVEDATCILSFADMSTYVMKPETKIQLARSTGPESKLSLVAGNIWVNVKKMVKDGSMEVDMSQAVAGIKGTTFVCSSDGKSSTLQVLEGTVAYTGKADKKTLSVTSGQQVVATGSGLGTPTVLDVAAAQADWDSVKAKAMSGTPAPTRKSGVALSVILAGICIAAAAAAMRRQ
jgi:hypothetical protein